MATRSVSGGRTGRSRHSRRKPALLDLPPALGQLRDGLSLIYVATRSLESIEPSEPRHVDQEIVVLRAGLSALEEAYNAIDRAWAAYKRAARP